MRFHPKQTVKEEDRQNRELLGVSHEILSLVTEVRALSESGDDPVTGRP